MRPGSDAERRWRGRRCRSLMAVVIVVTDLTRSTARDWPNSI